MRRDDVLLALRSCRAELAGLGVKSLSIFGSVARDEARADSDVDLLVEFDERPMGLFEFLGIKEYLEGLLGTRVDLVPRQSVRRELRDRILSEEVRAT